MSSLSRNNTLVRVNFPPVPKRGTTTRSNWPLKRARNVLKKPDWHDSEKLFCQLFNNSSQPMSITTVADDRFIEVNPTFLSRLGYTRDQVIGRTAIELGIWESAIQRAELMRKLKAPGKAQRFESYFRGAKNQALIWSSSAELIDIDGESCILTISDDITTQRQSEERLKNVSARLIRAQEEERNRIARELHDSLNQKLALLCVDVEEFSQTQRNREVAEWLRAWSLKLQDASADVDDLSHQLHPSKLDHLGFLPALESLCRELSGRRGLQIKFACAGERNFFEELDKEKALCAYRVVQEALGNVIKHSGALTARVQVRRLNRILYLFITDAGKGFDVETAKQKGRLGLIGMDERLRLANGTLIIRSKPDRGTQIEARIPLPS